MLNLNRGQRIVAVVGWAVVCISHPTNWRKEVCQHHPDLRGDNGELWAQ